MMIMTIDHCVWHCIVVSLSVRHDVDMPVMRNVIQMGRGMRDVIDVGTHVGTGIQTELTRLVILLLHGLVILVLGLTWVLGVIRVLGKSLLWNIRLILLVGLLINWVHRGVRNLIEMGRCMGDRIDMAIVRNVVHMCRCVRNLMVMRFLIVLS